MKPIRKTTNPAKTPPPTPTLDEEDNEGGRPDDYQYPSNPTLGLFRTQEEVALLFKVSRRTVSSWMANGAPGKWPCGRYDVVEIRRWIEGLPIAPYFQKKG